MKKYLAVATVGAAFQLILFHQKPNADRFANQVLALGLDKGKVVDATVHTLDVRPDDLLVGGSFTTAAMAICAFFVWATFAQSHVLAAPWILLFGAFAAVFGLVTVWFWTTTVRTHREAVSRAIVQFADVNLKNKRWILLSQTEAGLVWAEYKPDGPPA